MTLARDRSVGQLWEEEKFPELIGQYRPGWFTRNQRRRDGAAVAERIDAGELRRMLLPDVVIWSAPTEHHEIKHKNATSQGMYGLEVYRFRALVEFAAETRQPVLYTIHDWELAGASSATEPMPNVLAHWLTIPTQLLEWRLPKPRTSPSWVNGEKRMVPTFYWPTDLWEPLADWWEVP